MSGMHTYRVPIDAFGAVVVAAESARAALEVGPGVTDAGELEATSDPVYLERIRESKDEVPLAEARNLQGEDGGSPVVIPNGEHPGQYRRTRQRLGFTQRQVAEKVGVSRRTIGWWETKDMKLSQAREYANALHRLRMEEVR